jgi:PPM family protein phosphatase
MTTDNPGPGGSSAGPREPERPPPIVVGDRVEMAALSHAGYVRPNNEDVYVVATAERALRIHESNLPPGTVRDVETEVAFGMLVADGVGGMAAGEVASRMAVTTLIQLSLDTPDWVMLQGQAEGRRILDRATERFRHIDQLLRAEGVQKPDLAGMGTTMTMALVVGRELLIAHVGDSRAYLSRGDKFDQLTRDHTTVQD